jgi:membrane protein
MPSTHPLGSSNYTSLRNWADKPLTECSRFTTALHFLMRVLLITISEFKKSELSPRSSALTYTILLSLVPMLAMSTAVIKGFGGGDQLRKAAYTYIESLETSNNAVFTDPAKSFVTQPPEKNVNLTGHLRSAVDKLFNYVDNTNFATLGTIGVVGMLISVLLVLGHIESAMNAIWKVAAARSIPRKIADYLTLMILLPISINIAFAAIAFLKSPVLASKMDRFIPFDWLQSLLLKPVPILFITLSFYVMYIFFPNTRVKSFPAAIGATLAALLCFTVQNVYITLQLGVAKYNAIYGSFAILPLFLIWMYLGWLIILTGAQVAFAFQNVKTYRLLPVSGAPSLKLGAAFDIMDYIYTAFAASLPITALGLSNKLPHYAPVFIQDTLDVLLATGMVQNSQKDDRLLPTSPLERYDRQKIVNIILGTETTETAGGILSRKAIEAAGTASAYQQIDDHREKEQDPKSKS